jgi:hypothetical protein
MTRIFNFDIDLLLKDAGAITSSAAAQVGGSARQIDVGGASKSLFEAELIIDVSAIDFTSANETYQIEVEVSDTSGFGSGVVDIVWIPVYAVGRIRVGVSNLKSGTAYRYMRLTTTVGGTTPSINYTAFLAVSQS